MPLIIVRNDITKMNVDAIVNAANTGLQMGGGVCGAIFSGAGADALQAACDKLAPVMTGKAAITSAFALPAKYVVHAVGPIYSGGKQNEELLLRSCYINALDLAKTHNCESIAFPLISSGIYGYPKDEALSVATGAIGEWLLKNDMNVSLVVFDKAAFALPRDLLYEIKSFIAENYVDNGVLMFKSPAAASVQIREIMQDSPAVIRKSALSDIVGKLDEPFSKTLLQLIDSKGKTDAEIYKKANIDRKLFSKIRNPDYRPSKKTAVALSIALKLTLGETEDLLGRAGFALSHSQKFDVIVKYFIMRANYDIYEINNVLFEYDQPLLGG